MGTYSNNVHIAINLPEDIGRHLEEKWGDLPRRAREALVVEAYRSGALSQAQVQAVLGLTSRWETDALLKRAGAYLEYTEADLTRDLETSHRVRAE